MEGTGPGDNRAGPAGEAAATAGPPREAAALADRIEAAWTAIASRRDALLAWEAGGGPAAALIEPSAAWDPGRILAHQAEMVRYWLGEMERILAGGDDPVPVGRTATDPIRALSVERDRTLPLAELLERTHVDVGRVGARLRRLDRLSLERKGLHPIRGETTLAQLVESTLAKHLEDHAVQLDEALGLAGVPGAEDRA